MSPSSLPEFPAIFHDSYRPSFWRSHPVFVSVVGFLILCALVLIGGLLVSIQTVDATLRGRDALLQAREHVFALELGDARQSLLEADDAFRSARRSTRLLSPVRLIPGIGRYHEVGVLFLESADHMTQILLSALGSLEDATRLVDDLPSLLRAELVDGEVVSRWSALPEQSRRLFLERLAASVPEMQVRSAELDVTLAKLEHTLAQPIAAVLASPLSRVFHELVRARDDLNRFIQAASLVPLLSNASGQSRILVLFLNDTELRPGGGFLGSFAIIHLNAGLLQSIESYDVLALDAPVLRTRTLFPPPPLAEYLDVPAWFVRDANWSPDIPTSMDWTLRFYAQELDEAGSAARVPEGPPFDAVVGARVCGGGDPAGSAEGGYWGDLGGDFGPIAQYRTFGVERAFGGPRASCA
ncbi:MAG: hypothetical protein UY95_C0026G0005 [Parcubacteria group bacterium GW2011_GWA2_56_7]|nr:MAG: hypothetical protein UY95_C0026G0005 [Parcubacteria group bacterium GW2011_GWA2_56_7]